MKVTPAFRGLFGVARRDISPPAGIYSRNWGAANLDVAQSLHRPLTLTALVIRGSEESTPPLALISLDLSWWRSAEEEALLAKVVEDCEFPRGNFALALSHTHAAPVFCPQLADKPGGGFIQPYLDAVAEKLRSALLEAGQSLKPGILETATGFCGLAANRDLPEPGSDRFLVGWNPEREADQTLLVGRISDASGTSLATVVNYACHPTILAWENTTISPDYVGSMRELVEKTTGAPLLFLQGASGELAPPHQYVGNPAVADQAGRCLGHAALSALETLLPPGQQLVFKGIKESGAPLAVWQPESRDTIPSTLRTRRVEIDLPITPTLPSLLELEKSLENCTDTALRERLVRKRFIRLAVGNGGSYRVDHPVWQLGDILLVGVPNEIYSPFQQRIREAARPRTVFVSTLTNGSRGYLSPSELYDKNLYPIWQSPFAKGTFELVTDRIYSAIRALQLE